MYLEFYCVHLRYDNGSNRMSREGRNQKIFVWNKCVVGCPHDYIYSTETIIYMGAYIYYIYNIYALTNADLLANLWVTSSQNAIC